ncbi:MAG: glycosyltransferase [archaeon]|nr:glycosyltransferase [archaeon]
MKQSLVSVIVPTKNSAQFLDKCLESVKNQTYPNVELIVVDNNSSDSTKEIAKKYTSLVFNKGPERCAQVNYGATKAKGKYIYRVDSDFILEKEVISQAVDQCENKGFDAIAVHNTSDSTISFWAKVRQLERDCYEHDTLNIAARFFSKELFNKVSGFNENLLAAEDYDLHNRVLAEGAKIGFVTAKEVHIGEPTSLWEIAQKHYYYGKTIGQFLKQNPQRGTKQLSPIRGSYLKNWKKFLLNPVMFIGFLIYQIVRYTSAAAGFIAQKVVK